MALYLTDENGKLIQIAGILPIINDLTSDRADLALSAAQGKALKTLIENISINGGYDDTELKQLISNIRSDLNNYYTKTETDSKVSAIPKFTIQVVEALPSTGISYSTIYLVLSGEEDKSLYTEYIYIDNKWEKLGEQSINLDNYVTLEKLNETLKDYCTITAVTELINKSLENYVTLETMNAQKYLTEIPENYVTEEKLNNKGFLTTIPDDYITLNFLEQQNYLKALPDEAVTETELNSKGFAKQTDLETTNNLVNSNSSQIAKFKTSTLKESGLLDMIYPVGTGHIFFNDLDPNVAYGGTWVRVAAGKTIWTTTTAGEGGKEIAAGLPNIKGTFKSILEGHQFSDMSSSGVSYSGALAPTYGPQYMISNGSTETNDVTGFTFNANSYNSIYNDNTKTVQPPAVKVYLWYRTA